MFEGTQGPVEGLDSGKSMVSRAMNGGNGRWAGERLLAAINEGRDISPAELRSNATLPDRAWIDMDTAIQEAAAPRLNAVADLIAAGLTRPVTNAMGVTVLGWEMMGDMDPAIISMDPQVRSENDRVEFDLRQLPLPVAHKDFHLGIRQIAASRRRGETIDQTQARIAGRKVGEILERTLIQGGPTFGGLPIYGYLTHPNRNTMAYGNTALNWDPAGAKTGDQILADVLNAMGILEADGYYGPYWLYVPRNVSAKLETDFKAAASQSIFQRLTGVNGINRITYLDQLPANNVLLIQPTADVVQWVMGETIQTIQWDVNGGMTVNFKAFAIQVPLIRADILGRSGIVHIS